MLIRNLTSLLFCIAIGAAVASPLSPVARTEIDRLMSTLEGSGCEFHRNGTWYTGTEAKAHLLRKLKYLQDRDLVQSTERFIESAASASISDHQPSDDRRSWAVLRGRFFVAIPHGEFFNRIDGGFN